MFAWLFKTKEKEQVTTPSEDLARAMELLTYQNDLIDSLQHAVVDANNRAQEAFYRGHETIASLLMSSGGEALLSKEVLEVTHTSNYEIECKALEDGSVRLSLVPVANNETQDTQAQQAQEEPTGEFS